jgi:hypothetical protein
MVWAWNRADNVRVAYRQRLCVACVETNLAPLLLSAASEPLECPACHTEPGEQMDPIYVSYVLPGWDKEVGEFATCGPCAVEVRNRAQKGADLMEDRQQGVGAPTPSSNTPSAWDALGLRPPR